MMREVGRNFPVPLVVQQLGVSERTLRNWKSGALEPVKQIGRPALSPAKRFQARLKVARELHRQGWPGWRPVMESLGPVVSARLVQESVSELKKRRAKRKRQWAEAKRIHVEVLSPNVVWAQDATHVGRLNREAVQAEVIKDRATLGYVGVAVGPTARAEEILLMLEEQKQRRGLPLVWATDNGSPYRDHRVEEYLEAGENSPPALQAAPSTGQCRRGKRHSGTEGRIGAWKRREAFLYRGSSQETGLFMGDSGSPASAREQRIPDGRRTWCAASLLERKDRAGGLL